MRVCLQHPDQHDENERNAVNNIEQILCNIRKECTEEIETIYSELKTEISNNEIGYEICSTPYQGSFGIEKINYGKSLQEFIIEGAPNLVKFVKSVYAKEAALFRLMNEGYLMPIAGRTGERFFSVDLNLYRANLPLYVETDMMPFARYVVVKIS